MPPSIVWFRNDLRVADNHALSAASQSGTQIIAVYILDDNADLGGAQHWWLHHSLSALAADLHTLGAKLILRRGKPLAILQQIIAETGAKDLYWNRRYAKKAIETDTQYKQTLQDSGLKIHSFAGQLLHEPTKVRTGGGTPFRVYTPFWRSFTASHDPEPPIAAPKRISGFDGALANDDLNDWNLLPAKPDWSAGFQTLWAPGEKGAHDRLAHFLEVSLAGYVDGRDIPSVDHTSRLSPHLAFGEITPGQIWDASRRARVNTPERDLTTFRKELVWREFSYHLLVNFDDLATVNYNRQFDDFPWRNDAAQLKAWQKGQTGYPIVDAGMRQLWQTGWMHNRVRMIVGSFLIKHLLLDWRHGERWFWDTLVDADPASNAASWQWVAGSGADASPYFRIFNPILQGEKFDPDGAYVRKFVPELSKMPAKCIHKPWTGDKKILENAGVTLGITYPHPIVDHGTARERALAAYKAMKRDDA